MKIVFRADGNSKTGLGHIMRSSALMQMLQTDFSCRFLTRQPEYFPYKNFVTSPAVIPFDHPLAIEADILAEQVPADTVFVLDGYQFDTSYQQRLKDAGYAVVCIDDILASHFVADVIINHAGGVVAADYSAEPYTNFCLGPSYALVNPLFVSENIERDLGQKNILLSLGGADPNNDTEVVLDQLLDHRFEEIHVVLGSANKRVAEIKQSFARNKSVHVHYSLSSTEMHGLMKKCPYAVLSPSTVCYEYMSVGGVTFLKQIADNQSRIHKYFINDQLAFELTRIGTIPAEEMQASITRQSNIFDGGNSSRLKEVFLKTFKQVSA